MSPERTTNQTRQADRRKDSFVILIISTAIAAALAIGAYFYVFSESNEDLRAPVPEVGTEEEAPTPN